LVAALSLLAARAGWHQSSAAAPELACEETEHDFGLVTLAQARQLKHTFRLTNAGNQPVQITAVRTTCGCTSAGHVGTVAGPGSFLEVPIEANWGAKAGRVEQAILLETSSRVTPKLLLRIRGNVQVPVALAPAAINLGTLKAGEIATRLVRVGSGTATQPVAITSVAPTNSHLSLVRTDGEGRQAPAMPLPGPVGEFALCVEAPETAEPVREDETVTFQTDHPDVPSLTLRVEFQVEPAIQASPSSVLLGRNPQGQYEPQRVTVKDPPGSAATAELLWEGPGPNPFRLHKPISDDQQQGSTCFDVSFVPAEGNPALCRAQLVLKGGKHVRRIPIVAF
jgi:hypothetical protein